MSRTKGEQPAELIRMRQRLDEFRRGAGPGVALPGWVWAAASRLARRHGVRETCRTLGLEYNKLKRVVSSGATAAGGNGRSKRGAVAGASVKFVELTGALPRAGACRLHLAGPSGQRLELVAMRAARVWVSGGNARPFAQLRAQRCTTSPAILAHSPAELAQRQQPTWSSWTTTSPAS